ncbi:hypothetical protein M1D97_10365 [Kushneria sp. AK178]
MKKIIMGVGLLLAAPLAWSAESEMPRYDVEAECDSVARVGGNYSNTTYNGCMQMEQSAYNALKKRWSGLSASIRQECERVATVGGGGSYSTLQGCVQMEQTASNNQEQFEY